MTEEVKKDVTAEIKILITVNKDGQINVEGCIQNEPLAFWLLDKAKDIIKVYNIKNNDQLITPAKGGIMNFVKNRLK